MAGVLPKAGYRCKPIEKVSVMASLEELCGVKCEQNLAVIESLRDVPYAHNIQDDVAKDAKIGAMTQPEESQQRHVREFLLTRRRPVREETASGWRHG